MRLSKPMNDKILIENYEVKACHGVNPEEKIEPQRFLISCELFTPFNEAANDDDINATVSYAAVCKKIKAFFSENCFNLLETLSSRLTRLILLEFPRLEGATVTVKKPEAPMKGTFDYVGVTTSLFWQTAYISLGSNLGDRNAFLDLASNELKSDNYVKNFQESKRIETSPYGGAATETFVNSAARFQTLYTPQELLARLNEIEKKGERVRNTHWGNRTLDLDVIFYGDEIIEDDNLCVPHPDMQNRAFVLSPLNELCPNKLHPVLKKRVCELLSNVTLKKM